VLQIFILFVNCFAVQENSTRTPTRGVNSTGSRQQHVLDIPTVLDLPLLASEFSRHRSSLVCRIPQDNQFGAPTTAIDLSISRQFRAVDHVRVIFSRVKQTFPRSYILSSSWARRYSHIRERGTVLGSREPRSSQVETASSAAMLI
jgi:hypothetical protein